MTPRLRVVAKVGAFIFALFFVYFFVVYGLRYTKWVWFIERSGYYEAQFRSDNQKITFNDTQYVATNRKIQLYNIENGCYKIQFNNEVKTQCIQNGRVFFDVFLKAVDIIPYEKPIVENCPQIERQPHGTYDVKWLTFSKQIKASFVAREIQFLQIEDQLLTCTPDFKTCNEVASVQWEPICSVQEWLVYNDNWKLNLLSIQ